ncbi:MAG TPA: roadblock/LC7 domain-containing protein [Blastocatellia bacterium]|nr:roadblock/LC7 domain-containing protein [Blastocatellia bacterium]
MPFRALLNELVSSVEGATGAMVLEGDGEAVQWYALNDEERLRLRAAYIAVTMQQSRALTGRMNLGEIKCLILQYDGASFITEELDGAYFLLLELSPSANIGQALHRIRPAVATLRRAIAA